MKRERRGMNESSFSTKCFPHTHTNKIHFPHTCDLIVLPTKSDDDIEVFVFVSRRTMCVSSYKCQKVSLIPYFIHIHTHTRDIIRTKNANTHTRSFLYRFLSTHERDTFVRSSFRRGASPSPCLLLSPPASGEITYRILGGNSLVWVHRQHALNEC